MQTIWPATCENIYIVECSIGIIFLSASAGGVPLKNIYIKFIMEGYCIKLFILGSVG